MLHVQFIIRQLYGNQADYEVANARCIVETVTQRSVVSQLFTFLDTSVVEAYTNVSFSSIRVGPLCQCLYSSDDETMDHSWMRIGTP